MKKFEFDDFGKQGSGDCFRDKVPRFLESLGSLKMFTAKPLQSYQVMLIKGDIEVPLYVFIEHSNQAHCLHCENIGLISDDKPWYHVIIPKSKRTLGADFLADSHKYLLHGIVHNPGIGHLLQVNGMEVGSQISGRDMMSFWDQLSNHLKTWLVVCKDESKKQGMDLRLLYGIAYGHSWTGRWDYKLLNMVPGLDVPEYNEALSKLSNIDLDEAPLTIDTGHVDHFTKVVQKYRDLCDGKIVDLSSLFNFMLSVRVCRKLESRIDNADWRKMVFEDLLAAYKAITTSVVYEKEVGVVTGPNTYFGKSTVIQQEEVQEIVQEEVREIVQEEFQALTPDEDDNAEVHCFVFGQITQLKYTFGSADQPVCCICHLLSDPDST